MSKAFDPFATLNENDDADPLADLSGFQAKPRGEARPGGDDVDRIAEQRGFHSRPVVTAASSAQASNASIASLGRSQRRYRTGRNIQINLKATQETSDTFYGLCDELGVANVVVFEMAVAALREKLDKEKAG